MSGPERGVLGLEGLQALLDRLKAQGYRVLGPTVRDHAILYDDIDGIGDLPRGWTDEQAGGHYRLKRRDDDALFGYAVGPHAWKRFLHAPQQPLWRAKVTGKEARIAAEPLPTEKLALVGVRGCEAAAIAIQDRVLLGGQHCDPYYGARRDGAFLVAVNCGSPAATCFCTSMGTGPEVRAAHDLVLTELLEGGPHRFLALAGSEAGRAMLAALPLTAATGDDLALAGGVTERAAAAMTRKMPTEGLRDLMLGSMDHPRWDEVAERCLTCANCTMACPTCFCTTAQDENDLVTGEAVRSQHWASCFAVDFAYIHGGSVRPSPRARYRQWITHKLGTWWDQFGSSGCVGCGRCITWCPVGIDITEEVAALRGDAPAAKGGP